MTLPSLSALSSAPTAGAEGSLDPDAAEIISRLFPIAEYMVIPVRVVATLQGALPVIRVEAGHDQRILELLEAQIRYGKPAMQIKALKTAMHEFRNLIAERIGWGAVHTSQMEGDSKPPMPSSVRTDKKKGVWAYNTSSVRTFEYPEMDFWRLISAAGRMMTWLTTPNQYGMSGADELWDHAVFRAKDQLSDGEPLLWPQGAAWNQWEVHDVYTIAPSPITSHPYPAGWRQYRPPPQDEYKVYHPGAMWLAGCDLKNPIEARTPAQLKSLALAI